MASRAVQVQKRQMFRDISKKCNQQDETICLMWEVKCVCVGGGILICEGCSCELRVRGQQEAWLCVQQCDISSRWQTRLELTVGRWPRPETELSQIQSLRSANLEVENLLMAPHLGTPPFFVPSVVPAGSHLSQHIEQPLSLSLQLINFLQP